MSGWRGEDEILAVLRWQMNDSCAMKWKQWNLPDVWRGCSVEYTLAEHHFISVQKLKFDLIYLFIYLLQPGTWVLVRLPYLAILPNKCNLLIGNSSEMSDVLHEMTAISGCVFLTVILFWQSCHWCQGGQKYSITPCQRYIAWPPTGVYVCKISQVLSWNSSVL